MKSKAGFPGAGEACFFVSLATTSRCNPRIDAHHPAHQLSQEASLPTPPAPSPGESASAADDADSPDDEPAYDLGTRLHLYATVTEKAVYILYEKSRALAEMLFETKAEP